ncbi:hypothetical protein ACFSSA_13165 [Luteolibacter algae]|uniref:Uncharacterized protein n=1 Tax=Luteolibacter algae TaxID=454151 RepID=A0ABW5DC37_9BACT
MKGIPLIAALACIFVTSCEKKGEIIKVEETRGITSKDKAPKLFASSDERFRDAKPSPVQGNPPENWLKLPPAQFRLLNYRFGESGMGEVYVSLASGGVEENANRWLKQFDAPALSAAQFAGLDKIDIGGVKGVWIIAEGQYNAGMMGGEPKPGFALAGVIAQIDDQILTLKMIGPKQEVAKEIPALKAFAASLKTTTAN